MKHRNSKLVLNYYDTFKVICPSKIDVTDTEPPVSPELSYIKIVVMYTLNIKHRNSKLVLSYYDTFNVVCPSRIDVTDTELPVSPELCCIYYYIRTI